MIPSSEQEEIIDALSGSTNVLVQASPGSGKSCTVLMIASKYPDKTIFQLTYNAMLKDEIRNKKNMMGLDNLHVHTYHSLAVRFYDSSAHDDKVIVEIIENDIPARGAVGQIDILIIDEAQDMNINYYKLVKKFIRDHNDQNGRTIQMVILGDMMQSVYEFMGADHRYLTLGDKIYEGTRRHYFRSLPLSVTFRLSKNITTFVNRALLGGDFIKSHKEDTTMPVEYRIGSAFDEANKLAIEIHQWIKDGTYIPEDIFITSPSTKNNQSVTPLTIIEKKLVSLGIPCCTILKDSGKTDVDLLKGKVCIVNFNKTKGLEKKVMIMFSFDNSYMKFFARDADPSKCPNVLYVAATRASERLILIHDEQNEQLSFLKMSIEDMMKEPFMKVIGAPRNTSSRSPPPKLHFLDATELCEYLDVDTVNVISPLVDKLFEKVTIPGVPAETFPKIWTGKTYEDVSDLLGIAIPSLYEKKKVGTSNMIETTKKGTETNEFLVLNKDSNAQKIIMKFRERCDDNIEDYLLASSIYHSLGSTFISRLNQITDYKGIIGESELDKCLKNLDLLLKDVTVRFEKSIMTETISRNLNLFVLNNIGDIGTIVMGARVDAINSDAVYEFKCVSNLTLEHKLQIIVYSFLLMLRDRESGPRDAILTNIRTGETLKLLYKENTINKIMKMLIIHKYIPLVKASDEEFIRLHTQ